ncbi:hypothetical protein KC207_05995 [Phycicoccus sp. BSK3Z-2]|uniref:Uncharacterized protein n=1 Tax=Phycicoccus avicenniae TaxID=2828860 RepID=A0A941D6Y3_9MICO|nr:hypothetical protein [Phycicoccus avicenniae]MBR7742843.1 hypothetical protein [Phycicoccus avicenniae]
MIPARRWRPTTWAAVGGADLLVVLLAAPGSTGLVLTLVVLALVVLTGWALWRPGGWGALALVVAQVWAAVATRPAPVTPVEWALVVAVATGVLVTHLSLALLAAWPPGAGLPRPTAARWGRQVGALALGGGLAAVVAAVASSTPLGWEVRLGAVAVLLLGVVTVQLAVAARD